MLMRRSIRVRAFTLIELLVVIAIIALLLSIVVPSLRSAMELARRSICGTNMRSLSLTTITYANDEDDHLPPYHVDPRRSLHRSANHQGRHWYISDTGSLIVNQVNGQFFNLGFLWKTGRIDVGKVFYCPGQHVDVDFRYEYYADPVFPTPKRTEDGSGVLAVRVSYSYNPECVGSTMASERVMRYTRGSQMPSSAVLLADNINSAGPPHAGGWNVAYGDGSVSYFRDDDLSKLIENTWNFDGSGREAWEAWDEIIRRMKGR